VGQPIGAADIAARGGHRGLPCGGANAS